MLILTSLIQRFLKTWTELCKATLKHPEYNAKGAVNAIFKFSFPGLELDWLNWEKSNLLVRSYIPFNSGFVFLEWGMGWSEDSSKFPLSLGLEKNNQN